MQPETSAVESRQATSKVPRSRTDQGLNAQNLRSFHSTFRRVSQCFLVERRQDLGGQATQVKERRAYDETPRHLAGQHSLLVGGRVPVILELGDSERRGSRVAEQVHILKEQRHGRLPCGLARRGARLVGESVPDAAIIETTIASDKAAGLEVADAGIRRRLERGQHEGGDLEQRESA